MVSCCNYVAEGEAPEQQLRLRRTEDVELWLTRAETMLGELNMIVQQGDDELKNKCVGDCCPRNLKSTYEIGKRFVKKMDSVMELLRKAEPFYSDSAIVLKLPRLMPEWPLENTVGLDSAVQKERVTYRTQELIRKKLGIPDDIWNQSGEDEKGSEIFRVLKGIKFVFLLDNEALSLFRMPLALLTFARAMAGLDNSRQWRHTMELLRTHPSEIAGMGGHVFPLLKFSYDNLKEAKDQNCFLYCSLFPDDYNIRIDELIDLWVGEGFLDGSNPCDQGGFIVDALKSAYLLETDESKQCVRMHDIFRHMAPWLARDQGRKKNKVLVAKTGRLTVRELRKWEEANWISFFGCISTKVNISHSPSCPYLTTLLLREGELKPFPDGFFDSMPALKVLDLSGLKKLPTDLGNLRNLSKINGVNEYFGSVESPPYDEIDFLEALECLNHINKIVMECSGLISLHFTEEVHSNSSKYQQAVSLATLVNLEILKIFNCEALKEVTSDETAFPGLKTIHLTRLLNLKRICPSSRCFPSLLEIEVSECPLLRQLPFDLRSANFLQTIIGEIEWWNDLIWDDEAAKDVCRSKFVSTPFELIQNQYRLSLCAYGPPELLSSRPAATQLVRKCLCSRPAASAPVPPPPKLPTVILLQDLDVIKVISKGYSTTVQLVQHKWTGQLFALKERVISNILEYMDGGSLADFLKKVKSIPEPYLAAICKKALKGLIYLHHEVHVIHRDIKPSNLINHRGEVEITDFGRSAELISYLGLANTFCWNIQLYPERICGSSYGVDADIWSLGIVLLECATSKFPYSPPEQAEGWSSFYELMEYIVEGPAPSDQFSSEFCSFISACLKKDPKERKSARITSCNPLEEPLGGTLCHVPVNDLFHDRMQSHITENRE
ncbi:Mitogen-activated protein kinase kinase 1 [Hibiscus syriacus]|uniref:mitogen-activated protein kinase kinase n=1 Tax=Hibiscus syriacus TaxID=106335 RepID=A0A6A3D157_HIBSY|nr:Mitogen-activated protein kinase kinase 1 [Hibiscus syriacus]